LLVAPVLIASGKKLLTTGNVFFDGRFPPDVEFAFYKGWVSNVISYNSWMFREA
jgi:hypothetical protein